jgi:hypothetical protein
VTKALHCSGCNSIHTFKLDSSLTSCDCGKVQGWWKDPVSGIAALYGDHDTGSIISIHNGYLNDASKLIPVTYYDHHTKSDIPYGEPQVDIFWKQVHEQATITPRAPESVRIFDAARRACPFAIIEPGTTSDTYWATDQEAATKGVKVKTAS